MFVVKEVDTTNTYTAQKILTKSTNQNKHNNPNQNAKAK